MFFLSFHIHEFDSPKDQGPSKNKSFPQEMTGYQSESK